MADEFIARRERRRGGRIRHVDRRPRRQVELEKASPFDATPTAYSEHAACLSEAQVALREDATLLRWGSDLGAVGDQ